VKASMPLDSENHAARRAKRGRLNVSMVVVVVISCVFFKSIVSRSMYKV